MSSPARTRRTATTSSTGRGDQARAHRDARGLDLGRGRVERVPPPPGDVLHARAVGDLGERRWQPHRVGGRDRVAAEMRWTVGLTRAPRAVVRGGGGPHDEPNAAPHSMLYFSNPAVHANDRYQVIFPPDVDWATFHAKTDFAPWPLARGPFVGRDFAPGTDLSLGRTTRTRSPSSSTAPETTSSAATTTASGRASCTWPTATRCRARSSDLGQRARRAHVGPDPHRRGRAVHRAHDRRLLRQPARLLVDPAGRDAHRRALLVPGARAGRRQGREPRGRAQPRRERRPHAHRRQRDDPQARRAGAPHRRGPGRLRGHGTIAPDAPFAREVALPSGVRAEDLRLALLAADGTELVAYESRPRAKAAEPKRYAPPPPPGR